MTDPIPRLNAALSGRYRIERQLGEGGMATVYLADDLRHERKVALKVSARNRSAPDDCGGSPLTINNGQDCASVRLTRSTILLSTISAVSSWTPKRVGP